MDVPTAKWLAIGIVAFLTISAEVILVFILLPWLEYRLGDRKDLPRYLKIPSFIKRKKRVRIENPMRDRAVSYEEIIEQSQPGIHRPAGGSDGIH